jgi:CDP-paratose 2-epimerase
MRILVTGGAGFIGSHLAMRFAQRGAQVVLFDNLSRMGSEHNLAWVSREAPSAEFVRGDIRDTESVARAARDCQAIFHLAAQVAVTTSVTNPREDFEVNALGTFNVLEAARLSGTRPLVIYSSTNKVYGGMEGAAVVERDGAYAYADLPHGVGEDWPLDFHSPYGCSKGAGDQYVRDYARIYGLPTVVFRQSCIYGERQFGVEDQGWLAHFVIAAVLGRPITIYGDGKQVRDVLFIDDLLNAFERAAERQASVGGQVYNIGGGPGMTLAVWAGAGPLLETLAGHTLPVRWGDWRPGDQRIYVSDIRKAERDLEWRPRIAPAEGLSRLYRWVEENRALFT